MDLPQNEALVRAFKALSQEAVKVDEGLVKAIEALAEGSLKNDYLLLDVINALSDKVKKLEDEQKSIFDLHKTLIERIVKLDKSLTDTILAVSRETIN